MKLLLRCLLFSTILTTLIAGMLLRTAWSAMFALMLPALRLTAKLFESRLAISESGLNNFITLVVASSFVNIALYTIVLLLIFKVASRMRAE